MHGDIQAAFIGVVGSEPTLQTSAGGKPWAAFNVAVGNDDATQWVRVSIFKDLAEKLSGHLPKGSKVYCEGTLKLSHWTDKRTGEEKSGLQLACWKCHPLFRIGRNKLKDARAGEGDEPHSMMEV